MPLSGGVSLTHGKFLTNGKTPTNAAACREGGGALTKQSFVTSSLLHLWEKYHQIKKVSGLLDNPMPGECGCHAAGSVSSVSILSVCLCLLAVAETEEVCVPACITYIHPHTHTHARTHLLMYGYMCVC